MSPLATLSRSLFLSFVLICLLVLPAQSAESADGEPSSESFPFYVETKASLYLMQLPKYAPVAVRANGPSFALLKRLTTEDGEMSGVVPEITFGWRPDETLSSQNPLIVEGSVFYTSSSSTQNSLFDYPAAVRVGWYPIDGSKSATGLGLGHDIAVNTKRRMDHLGGELVVAQEISWVEGVTVRPYVGYSGMLLKQKFTTVTNEVDPTFQRMELDEEVTGSYHGAVVGAKIVYNTDRLESYLSGSIAAYLLSAEYKGHQYSSAGSYTVDHADTKQDLAGRFRIEAGSAYVIDRWKFGVNAGAEYLSAVPKIVASDKGTTPGTTDGSPTHIGSGESLAGTLGVDITFSF